MPVSKEFFIFAFMKAKEIEREEANISSFKTLCWVKQLSKIRHFRCRPHEIGMEKMPPERAAAQQQDHQRHPREDSEEDDNFLH